MRLVADTNVLVSAFFWGGPPRSLLEAAKETEVTLFTSPALIAELEDVFNRAKFAERIEQTGSSSRELIGDYLSLCSHGQSARYAESRRRRSR